MSKPSPHYKPTGPEKALFIEKFPHEKGQRISIRAPALDIIWGNDKRYWNIQKDRKQVELLQVSWLEVTGSLPLKDVFAAGQTYKISFNLKRKPDAFGWAGSPVYFMVKPGSEKAVWKKSDLSRGDDTQVVTINFTVPNDAGDLQFGIYEIWRGRWKGGLIIEGVEIQPA